jgi:hypothetical protein
VNTARWPVQGRVNAAGEAISSGLKMPVHYAPDGILRFPNRWARANSLLLSFVRSDERVRLMSCSATEMHPSAQTQATRVRTLGRVRPSTLPYFQKGVTRIAFAIWSVFTGSSLRPGLKDPLLLHQVKEIREFLPVLETPAHAFLKYQILYQIIFSKTSLKFLYILDVEINTFSDMI